ncbi:caspase-4-like isoform X2 [Arvicanthis niloticus]|uniref:caspase-4 isoform X2 n=1 Tax=Arvicanthis niloticus TaxID=61156 RepID=UPI00402BAD34
MCSNFRFTLRSFLHGAKELRLFLMAENNHPDKPLKILEKLGKEILTEYLEKSVQSNVVKLTEEEKEEFNNAEHSDKRRVIVDAMKRKHRKVGEMLLQTFLNVDPGSCHSEANPEMEEPEESVDTLKLCSPEEFARLCREKRQEIYPIKKANGRTRKALIICNIEFEHLSLRYGAQFDVIGMEALLKDLGYNVVVKKNLTAEGMESEMKDFAALSEHQTSDSTFLVLMSHGTLHGIFGKMHSEKTPDVLQYDTIYQIFNNCHCPGLRDKPKVIIVQACRGEDPGEVWIREPSKAQSCRAVDLPRNMEADAVRLSHVEKDFIAFYSTTPHHLSYRNETRGSCFITKLISCFRTHACSCHLFDIFLKVQQSFEKPSMRSQMPTIDRATLTRYFYLFPGN